MALQFRILTGSPLPIYRQVFDQVRMAIARGDFAEGEQLPSVRALAEQLLVNPNTIARAYAELTRDGLVDSQAGRGLFIARRRSGIFSEAERERRFAEALDPFLLEAHFLDYGEDEILAKSKRRIRDLQKPTDP
jgi:GntR family transcriptional regulator